MRQYLLSIEELLQKGEPAPGGTSERRAGFYPGGRSGAPDGSSGKGRIPGEERESGGMPADGFPAMDSSALLWEALGRVDVHRREKASRMKPGKGQAASLGAGLLLQLAVGEALEREKADHMADSVQVYGASALLARLESLPLVPLRYRYGGKGKPYLEGCPFYFSLSHSGDYVLCVISGQEVGADIQEHRPCDTRRLAERFFSERERAALEQARLTGSGQEAFFRLWARKEAYGKLTGDGIGGTVGLDMLPGEEKLPGGGSLVWEESSALPGYSMAVCRYRVTGSDSR